MKLLLVGLGNIGAEYVYTRHNIGFLVADRLAAQQKIAFKASRLAAMASFSHLDHKVYLIKPTTHMNNSGQAVKYWLHYLQIPLQQSLIILDDVALPFGVMRLRPKGSDAGHNGLKSIAQFLQSDDYPRLRIGIGSNFPKGKLSDFVLGHFNPQERQEINVYLDKASEILSAWCAQGIVYAMNHFN